MNTDEGRINFGITLDNTELKKGARESRQIFDGIASHAVAQGSRIDNAFSKVGSSIAAYFTLNSLTNFISQVVRVRAEIEALEISFRTLLGSREKASKLFADIREYAVKTPLLLNDIAGGAKMLLSFGISAEKVMPTLKQLGDISGGNAEKFKSLTLAFSQMSSAGKLMGQDLLQMINAGFNPLKVMSETTGKSMAKLREEMSAGAISAEMVAEAFAHAAGEGGMFYGMLEKQSQGIAGSISNLQGAFDDMLNAIGEKHQGAITGTIHQLTSLVQNYEKAAKVVAELVAAYGMYKATIIALHAVENMRYQATLIHVAGLTKQQALLTVLKAKYDALNASIGRNQYALMAAGVSALVYALYKLYTSTTAAEAAQKKLNEAFKDFEAEAATERIEIDRLFSQLKKAKEGSEAYRKVKNTITNQYGEYLKGLSQEIQTLKDVDAAYRAITASATEAAKARAMERMTSEAASDYGKVIGESREQLRKALEKEYKGRKAYDGIDFSEKYFWKIVPVLEGKEEMTKEIEDILKTMDRSALYAAGGVSSSAQSYTFNDAKDAINKALAARKIYEDTLKDAETMFGTLKKEEAGTAAREGESIKENKAYWEKVKKEQQSILDDMTRAELATEKAAEVRRKIAEAQRNIEAYNSQKQTRDAEDLAKSRDKLRQAQEHAELERMRTLSDMTHNTEMARIEAMKDGKEKTLEAMKENHARELEMLNRQKEDFLRHKRDTARALFEADPANKGRSFNEGAVTLSPAESDMFTRREKYTRERQNMEMQEELRRQSAAMDAYLAEYGEYLQKREALARMYAERIDNATTKGEQLSLTEELKEKLSELDMEANRVTSPIGKLFSDMSRKSVDDIRKIAEEAEKALNFLLSGEWDDEKGTAFGISKETFDVLRKSPAELDKIRNGIENTKDAADRADNSFGKLSTGIQKLFDSDKDTKDFKDGLELIEDAMNDLMRASSFLSDSLSDLGDAFGVGALNEIASGINIAIDGVNSARSGAKAGSMFGPWGSAAGAAIGLVSSLGKALAKLHDARHERKIQRIQNDIDVLEKSYERLGESIEMAYSKDASSLIDQQNTLLEQQKLLIRQQIKEEEKKKKTDKKRIKEWEQQIEDIDKLISDNKDKAVDAIFGQDLKSAIESFADAYANAWANGANRAIAAKDTVRQMMRQMVTESIKAAVQSSGKMEEIRKKLQEFYADNILSSVEQDYIMDMAGKLQEELDKQFGWAEGLLENKAQQGQGTSRGFGAEMTHEDAGELSGRFAALQATGEACRGLMVDIKTDTGEILLQNAKMADTMSEMRELSLLSLDHLETISKNTHELYEMNRRLARIEQNTKNL